MKGGTCLIGFGLLGASLYSFLAKWENGLLLDFQKSLDTDQLILYNSVRKDRMRLYLTGLAIGTALALLYLYWSPVKGLMANACLFMMIAWGFTYVYYTLMPKTTYMVQHLTSEEQLTKWTAVYRDMQWRYTLGFLAGALAYALICYGILGC